MHFLSAFYKKILVCDSHHLTNKRIIVTKTNIKSSKIKQHKAKHNKQVKKQQKKENKAKQKLLKQNW